MRQRRSLGRSPPRQALYTTVYGHDRATTYINDNVVCVPENGLTKHDMLIHTGFRGKVIELFLLGSSPQPTAVREGA